MAKGPLRKFLNTDKEDTVLFEVVFRLGTSIRDVEGYADWVEAKWPRGKTVEQIDVVDFRVTEGSGGAYAEKHTLKIRVKLDDARLQSLKELDREIVELINISSGGG